MRKINVTPEWFWGNVDSKSGKDSCWRWLGTMGNKGYGQVRYQGTYMHASRLAWIFSRGETPDGLWVCHKCDNKPCCNPSHLWLGTPRQNTLDAVAKGRMGFGEANSNAKLKNGDIPEIRKRYLEIRNYAETARQYGVSLMTVKNIVTRKSWSHLK